MKKQQAGDMSDSGPLRIAAEKKWRQKDAALVDSLSGTDIKKLLHEIGVHQIELEMQNEELLAARQAAEKMMLNYSDLYDFAPVAYFTLDEKGQIAETNLTAASMLGVDRSRLVGKYFVNFISRESQPAFSAFIKRLSSEEGKAHCELKALAKDDKVIYLLVQGILIGREGKTGGLCRIATMDTTKLRMMEERLRQTEKMEAIGKIAGGVAHDFNNLLTGIMGYADLLSELLEDPELKDYARNILIATRRASDLTNKLLSFSRKGKYLQIPINIHLIIEEAISILERTISRKVRIRRVFNANPPTILGDPTQILSVFLNLALNARDAMPDGGELVFTTDMLLAGECPPEEESPANSGERRIRITVSDTGIGMEKEAMKHIFEPFFTTKEKGKGTGMGLASVYGAVKNHRGSINVQSDPGRGSVFTLYFPLTAEAAEENKEQKAMPLRLQKLNILLVDDELIVRNLISNMLKMSGCKVVACKDGAEAVELFPRIMHDIDLVILDMEMPRKDGRETFFELKAMCPDVKVLIASGYSMDGFTEELMRAGVKGLLQKPFGIEKLIQSVQDAMD